MVRKMIVSNYGGVRIDGTNATIIGNGQGKVIADRNNITRVWMDHAYWPFVTTKLYMDQTGDLDILLDKVSYFKDRQSLRGTAHDDEWKFEDGNTQKTAGGVDYFGTVIEHILLQNLCAFYDVGEHNEMRLHGADWNDALDMAWERGESVAFTCAYAGNLKDIAYYLRKIESTDGIRIIEVAKEMECLFRKGKELYENPYKKQQLLSEYSKLCCHNISGEKAVLKISMICENLEEKADWLMKNIRENEWIKEDDNTGWFNGYYDNHGKKVEYYKKDDVRMMLTSQVFAIMSGTADEKQIKAICNSADKYLYEKKAGGYRLNTDFKEEKFDLVISNRSMLEITNLPKLKSFWSIDEVENSIVVANSVLKFFKSVEKVMTHDAKLITFERLDGLEEILNFIKSMHASGLYADIDSMCKIQFNELNDVEQMPLIVFDKTERDEIGFYDAIEIYNKLPILNKQKDIEDEFAIELQFKALGEKELVYGTQIDYKTGVGSERREVWKVGDKYVTYKYSNVGRRELVTEGIEKDKAINEIRAMSNFIGRIGHKVTEYHSIEEREKLVK